MPDCDPNDFTQLCVDGVRYYNANDPTYQDAVAQQQQSQDAINFAMAQQGVSQPSIDIGQPPVVALAQPALPLAASGATVIAPTGNALVDWFQQTTTVSGYIVPNWTFAAAAGALAFLLMRSKKGKR